MRRRWRGLGAFVLLAALFLDGAGGTAGAAARPRPRRTAARPAPALRTTLEPYRGLGTWIDVYDWTRTYRRSGTPLGVADIDRMADRGVQTLFVQTGKWDAPDDIVDRDLLLPLLGRARARGIRTVAWYLPTLVDLDADLRRLVAASNLDVDGIAVDIEARNVANAAERSRRLVRLSAALRKALPGRKIGAIVMPPVFLDSVSPRFWPGFPWQEIRPYYDVWLPMAYWSDRKKSSGWRDGYRYTAHNMASLRRHLRVPGAPIHFIGGIASSTIPADVGGMNRAAHENGALGASLYDWRTTGARLWPYLQPLRLR